MSQRNGYSGPDMHQYTAPPRPQYTHDHARPQSPGFASSQQSLQYPADQYAAQGYPDQSYDQSYDQTYDNGGYSTSTTALNHQISHAQPSYPPLPSPQISNYPYGQSPQQQYFQQQQQYQQQQYYLDQQYQETARARAKMFERREVKQIQLTDGNLVLDLPVPRSILRFSSFKGDDIATESGHLRYTAVTCDPDDFTRQKYRLRTTNSGRQTELAIFLTMYNEDDNLFCRTFTAVVKNIAHLQSRTKSKTWGDGSWKKVVVCVVSDGRAKINPRTLKVLGLYGAFQEGVMKDTVDGRDVTGHLFEYTTQVVVDKDGLVSGGVTPVQIMFLLKEQNKKKLNSHRWCFNAFGPQLQPNVCILLDVGTRPSGTSIYSLWKAFDKNKSVGGACGEITVDTGRGCGNLLNVLVAAQNFEYKMSNILDKPLESVFGYISVLPGAFSAYRYKALLGKPLQAYFLGEKMHEAGSGVKASLGESNMYLAEDRVLCFEIVAKKKEHWTLKYVKAASASTDVPDTVAEFVSQRRRWNNGALFSSIHATSNYFRLWTSGQSFLRKCWLSILFFYNLIQLVFQLFALGNFYLAFFFLCNSAVSDPANDPFGGKGPEVISVANSIYIALIGIIIVVSLGNKPQGSKWAYTGVMVGLAAIFGIALYCTGWTIYLSVPKTLDGWRNVRALLRQSGFRDIVISLGATYFLYILSSVLHADPWHLFTSFIQYMFFLPSFVSVLSIYSIANLQDLAWGTKGSTTMKDLGKAKISKNDGGQAVVEVSLPTKADDVDELWLHAKKDLGVKHVEVHEKRDFEQKRVDDFANSRTNWLLFYLGINMVIVIFFTSTFWTTFLRAQSGGGNSNQPVVNYYMVGIFWSTAVLSAFRFLGSTLYLILRLVGW